LIVVHGLPIATSALRLLSLLRAGGISSNPQLLIFRTTPLVSASFAGEFSVNSGRTTKIAQLSNTIPSAHSLTSRETQPCNIRALLQPHNILDPTSNQINSPHPLENIFGRRKRESILGIDKGRSRADCFCPVQCWIARLWLPRSASLVDVWWPCGAGWTWQRGRNS
jgi:hypothetical protein